MTKYCRLFTGMFHSDADRTCDGFRFAFADRMSFCVCARTRRADFRPHEIDMRPNLQMYVLLLSVKKSPSILTQTRTQVGQSMRPRIDHKPCLHGNLRHIPRTKSTNDIAFRLHT